MGLGLNLIPKPKPFFKFLKGVDQSQNDIKYIPGGDIQKFINTKEEYEIEVKYLEKYFKGIYHPYNIVLTKKIEFIYI